MEENKPLFTIIKAGGTEVAELQGIEVLLKTADDALTLMVSARAPILILHVRQIAPDFFRLPTGLLGEVLQKLTNYRVRMAVVGDFSPYLTRNFSDFIRESNRAGDFLFLATKEEAITRYAKA